MWTAKIPKKFNQVGVHFGPHFTFIHFYAPKNFSSPIIVSPLHCCLAKQVRKMVETTCRTGTQIKGKGITNLT